MTVPLAYLGVILIWSTTPLAIQWSSAGVGFLFSVTVRMAIAVAVCALLVRILRISMRWRGAELLVYVASSMGIYCAMLCVYWGAQYIPSGLVSVIYGLLPIVTTLVASVWFRESLLQPAKLLGLLLGVIGLYVIFASRIELPGGQHLMLGVMGVLASVTLHAISMVWVKRLNVDVHPVAITTGGLMIAMPLYLLTWFIADGHWPGLITAQALGAIVYLGIVGSVVGFILYFYVLKKLAPEVVALITLITPVCALILGYWVNHERLDGQVVTGVMLILSALLVHQWGLFNRKKLDV